jgi:tRNA-binding EMAP/Myf-like protein
MLESISRFIQHPASENLYCEKINVCGELREIASGLQKFVPLEQMTGRVLVMANLKPRPLAGFNSNGMVVCASNADHTVVELLIPEGELGERIYLEGFEELFPQGQLQPVLNPKKKIVERCLEHFKTDEEGYITWKGIKVRTKAGLIKAATVRNGNVA